MLLGAPCGYVSFDDARVLREVNAAGADLLGCARDELVGRPLGTILPPASRVFFEAHLLPLIALRGRADELYVTLRGPGGRPLPVLMSAARAVREGGGRVDCVFLAMGRRDQFERELVGAARAAEEAMRLKGEAELETERARARLALHERLASLGTLAAGVAHEINNPLSYVAGNLELLGEALSRPAPDLDEIAALVHEAREGAERIRDVVDTLRALSRVESVRAAPVDLARVVDLALRIAGGELRRRARVEYEAAGPAPTVDGDEGRLTQVVINLLVNATQALDPGSAVRNLVRVVLATDAQGWAVLEVCDNGPGMSAEVQSRIFEPFFTTKPVGQGTGLGLSLCHNIIASLGGTLSVESAPGQGACFRVVLPPSTSPLPPSARPPRSSAAPRSLPASAPPQSVPSALSAPFAPSAPSAPSVPSARAPAPGATAAGAPARPRVLVVDDDTLVATVLVRALGDYEVVVESSSRAAIARVEAGETFELIVCDLLMPEMTGMDVHAALVRVAPALASHMVFMTGSTFSESVRDFLASVPNRRLAKPFGMPELRQACAAALAEARASREPAPSEAPAPPSTGGRRPWLRRPRRRRG